LRQIAFEAAAHEEVPPATGEMLEKLDYHAKLVELWEKFRVHVQLIVDDASMLCCMLSTAT